MKLQTRALLAGAYKNGRTDATLTHAVEVLPDEHGYYDAIRVLCGGPKLASVADEFASDVDAEPTCPLCARRRRAIEGNRSRILRARRPSS